MNKKGFTLIELLVVIAIIGLLSTLAVVALGNARQKANDAKRLSDIKQTQTALELYYTDNNSYPVAADAVNLGKTNYVCIDTDGFDAAGACTNPFMGLIPTDPNSTLNYAYTSAANSGTYAIDFALEVGSGGFASGGMTASPSGIVHD